MGLFISSSANRDLLYYIPINILVLDILMEKFKTIKQNQMVLLQSRLAQNGLSIRLAVKNNHRVVKMYEGVLTDIKTNIKLAQRFTNLQKLLTHMNTEHNCQCNFTQGYIKIQQNFFQVGKIQLKPVQLSPDFQIKRMIEKCQSNEEIGISQIKIMISILGSSIIQVKNQQKTFKNQLKQQIKKEIQVKEQKKVKAQILSQVLNLQVQKSEAKIEQNGYQKKEQKKNVQIVEKKDEKVQLKQQKQEEKLNQREQLKNNEKQGQKDEYTKKQLQNIIQKRMSKELKVIETEINSQFQKLSQKFEKHFKSLNTKIEDSSYQTQKKLYQKFSYLFKQINNDIDIISTNQTQMTRNSMINGRQSIAFDMIIDNVNLSQPQQSKISQRRNSIRKQMNQQGLIVTRSRLSGSEDLIKRRHSISYKIRNEKITVKNQKAQPHIFAINQNIKSEQLKGACRIKIQIFKKGMGIGMIDQRMIEKPINDIGERFGYYRNDRQVWNGVKMLENQGSGFVIGQIIQFTYDLMSKIMQWRVNDKLRYTMKFESLNINENWIPFVYLFSKDDTISILPL